MKTWQENGVLKWDSWQYLFMSDIVEFHAEAVGKQLAKNRELVCREYLANTDRLIVSPEIVREITEDIVSQVNANSAGYQKSAQELLGSVLQLTETAHSDLSDIRHGMDEMVASINWGNERIIWHMSDLKKTVQMPIDNQALNHREHGIHAYQNGWFDEALKEFHKAENTFGYDFITHQYLGDLYLHHKKDLDKALEYFQKAAKYSMIKDAPEKNRKISSWAELHTALVYYKRNNFEEAAKGAFRATEKNASAEALYQLGHYLSLTAKKEEHLGKILKLFELAIRKDPVYFLKIDVDHNLFESDLLIVKNEMKAFKEALWREEKEKTQSKMESIRRKYNSTNWHFNANTKELLERLERDIRLAEEMFRNRQSYIDFRIIQNML